LQVRLAFNANLIMCMKTRSSGNMFDWGAKEVVSEINAGCLVFESAKHKIIRGHKTWDLADAFLERYN